MLTRLHTYDLDGVLVDSSHRYRNLPNGAIDLDYWFAKRHLVHLDRLLPLASQYKADCENPEIYVILCTARAEHPDDIAFIFDRLGKPNKLLMRPVGNMERDAVLKFRQLQRIFNLRQFGKLPRRLWEDNPRNVEALKVLFSEVFLIESKQGA